MVACCAVQHLPQGSALCQLPQVQVKLSVWEHTMANVDELANDSTSPSHIILMW